MGFWESIGWIAAIITWLWLLYIKVKKANLRKADQNISNCNFAKPSSLFITKGATFLSAILDRIPNPILIINTEGEIKMVNPAFAEFFSSKIQVGNRWDQYAALSPLQEVIKGALTKGEWNGTIEIVGLVSKKALAYASKLPGSESVIIVALQDITKAVQFDQLRRDFVANVSHELRSPLTVIKGYAETLMTSEQMDYSFQRKCIEAIYRHSQRLENLVNDLLVLSDLESGKSQLNLQPIRLREIAETVVEELLPKAQSMQVYILNTIPSDIIVCGDEYRLMQVFQNLLDNAIKYGNHPGHVVIGARVLNPSTIEAWVKDDGPGIPPEAQERIFERFYRIDKARSREHGGTGLGLAIVKHIVQAHGGQVRVESRLGHGATFFFTIPTAKSNLDVA